MINRNKISIFLVVLWLGNIISIPMAILTQNLSDYFAAQFVHVVESSHGCGARALKINISKMMLCETKKEFFKILLRHIEIKAILDGVTGNRNMYI